jgi:hypothetical protein
VKAVERRASAVGEAGLVDAGPLVGVWYLAVTIQVLRSLGWLRRELADPDRRPD